MKKSNNKGITLIALVITIIVMLILVVVTINVATNGGLIEKAKEGNKKTTIQSEHEELLSIVLGAYDEETGAVLFDKLEEGLGTDWTILNDAEDFDTTSKTIQVQKTGSEFTHTINQNGTTNPTTTNPTTTNPTIPE